MPNILIHLTVLIFHVRNAMLTYIRHTACKGSPHKVLHSSSLGW